MRVRLETYGCAMNQADSDRSLETAALTSALRPHPIPLSQGERGNGRGNGDGDRGRSRTEGGQWR